MKNIDEMVRDITCALFDPQDQHRLNVELIDFLGQCVADRFDLTKDIVDDQWFNAVDQDIIFAITEILSDRQ